VNPSFKKFSKQVDDLNPSMSFTGQLTDVSQVDKFEMSDADYAKRQGV
jgi:tubulin-specific chaperone B